MNNPRISIIIPNHNLGKYLVDAIKSVEKYPDKNIYELIIVDDGSNDKLTLELLKSYEDDGYRIIWQENLGLAAARNSGIQLAKGEFILPLDADNKIEVEFINKAIELFDKNPQVGVVYGNAMYFEDRTGLWEVKDFDFSLLLDENYIDACAFFRKSLWSEINGYDEEMPVMGWEDWDFWLRSALTGTEFFHLNMITFLYRVRPDSIISETKKHIPLLNKYIFSKQSLKFLKTTREKLLLHLEEKKLIQLKSEEINKKNKQFEEIKHQLAKLNNLLIEKDKLITQRDNIIKEDNNKISGLNKEITNHKTSLLEKDKIIAQKIKQISEFEIRLNEEKTILTLSEKTIDNLTRSFSWRVTKPLRLIKNNKIRRKFLLSKNIKLVKHSNLFDEKYYLKNNPDVKKTGEDPVTHFVKYGGFEGRNPGPKFDANYYNTQNPDVIASGLNPLVHYILYGKKEGRQIVKTEQTIIEQDISKNQNPDDPINLIRQSKLFDADYYLRTNADIKAFGMDPAHHYYYHGWKEGRNPSNEFDTNYYLNTNSDVQKLNSNPLIHYIKLGKKERRLTKPFEFNEQDFSTKADINNIETINEKETKFKVAVVFHLYHIDLVDEFIEYFKNIPIPYDIYISTTSNNIEKTKKIFSSKLPELKTVVVNYENRGRDIGPFLIILKDYLQDYELICKVHTKQSNHDINLNGWRKHLLDNLLGNSLIIDKIISEFSRNKKLGIVWPIAYPYLSFLGLDKSWGSPLSSHQNFSKAKKHFPELELGSSSEEINFPNGSMFWFRPEALSLLTKKGIKISDFEKENQQIDGTLAHTIERLFGLITKHSGFEIKTTFFPKKIINNVVDNYHKISNSKSILFVAHDLFWAGAEILLLSLIQWLKKYTALNLFVLAIKPGNDGAKLLSEYEKVSQVFMWNEYCDKYDEKDAMLEIKSEIGNIDLIYGNTIIAANIYSQLTVFDAPFITHVHELEESIQRYTTKEVRDKWKQYTSLHIACSKPVEENLIASHDISRKIIACVNEFIRPIFIDLPDKKTQRIINDLPKEKIIIWGCGTIYWRKGTDIFIETAKKIKEKGVENFCFYWIGGNHWDLESNEWGEWSKWEEYIEKNDLKDYVVFLSEKERPREYFTSGDIFFLPSREDPFPLVCLEAAECGLPVICFKDAGGMPDFVEQDAGAVVPYLDIDAAATALENLITNKTIRVEKGLTARKKLFQQHSDDIAAPKILQICNSVMKSMPLVSVIVPIYNHEKFLKERIDSILNQSFRDFEIIILDDASSDNSYEIAKSYEWHPAITVIKNEFNTGSPFKQWQKGVELAKGKYIWIAEGDDTSNSEFLSTLLPAFNNDEIKLAYCASNVITETGDINENHYLNSGHYDKLNYPQDRWKNDYTNIGTEEVKNALAIRNTIPNVSAVLFRGDAIRDINFEQCSNFKNAGDWFVYVSILKNGSLHYHSGHLNYHRVHSNSVVAQNKLKASDTIPDYFEMHKLIVQDFYISEEVIKLMTDSVVKGLKGIWPEMSNEEFIKHYNPQNLENLKRN